MSDELTRFLAARLEGGSEWVGNSSNAMVREALGGERVHAYWEYPHDHSDLSRCCMTYARAPWSLKAIMLPRLTAYCEYAMNGFREPEPIQLSDRTAAKQRVKDAIERLKALGKSIR